MNEEDTPNDQPYDPSIPELTLWELFYGDKRDLFEVKDSKQDWSRKEKEVELFWRAFRETKMKKKDFDFSEFVFPVFLDEAFWLEGEKREFSADADFSYATFSAEASFDRATFSTAANFVGTTFSAMTDFQDTNFSSYTSFIRTKFLEASFYYTNFSSHTEFINTSFDTAKFLNPKFSFDTRCLFQQWNVEKVVSFEDAVFPDKVQFQRCDMDKVEFKSCDLVKIYFSNCRFPTNWFGRLAMKNDNFNKMADLAEMYRQLKRNRMEARDWTTAGDAYRSEMVMKLRLIGRSILRGRFDLIFSGLIISFHGLLSAFQQSLTRPLFWLAALLLAVPFKLYESAPDQGMYTAWKTSLDAAFPVVGKIDVGCYDQDFYFLLVAERILTIILITFFGLATRARLRQ